MTGFLSKRFGAPRSPGKVAVEQESRSLSRQLKDQGNEYLRKGQLAEAADRYQQAIHVDPEYADAFNNLGFVYKEQQRLAEAEDMFRRAVALDQTQYQGHFNLGTLSEQRGNFDEAASHYRSAIRQSTGKSPEAHWRLARILLNCGAHGDALDVLGQSLSGWPLEYQTHFLMAMAYEGLGEPQEARRCFEKGHVLGGENCVEAGNLAMNLLLHGDLEGGFSLFETYANATSKTTSGQYFRPRFSITRWQGNDLRGKRLAVWGEHGLGDVLMMLRYLPLIRGCGPAWLEVHCDRALVRLIETMAVADKVIAKEGSVVTLSDDLDFQCSIMSLPFIFKTRLESVPSETPYLNVPPEMKLPWESRLRPYSGMRVGIVWSGNPSLGKDSVRSISLDRLAPLMAIHGVTWVSLQKGPGEKQLSGVDWPILNWMDTCSDMLDTASLAATLDLLVCVDTSVAHLAGALGRPVWLLNRHESEWRWLLEQESSPWYPTMRIFRQPAPFDWDSVVADVGGALRAQLGRQ